MLLQDLGISPEHVDAIQSAPSTGGNIDAIRAAIGDRHLELDECAVVSNHYHLPRIQLDLRSIDLPISAYPAEAFPLLACETPEERAAREDGLIGRFGQGPLAERLTEEVSGIAAKLRGSYRVAPSHVGCGARNRDIQGTGIR